MSIVEHIANLESLDALADRASQVVRGVTSGLGRPAANALHGTWLGHPLHPALTDVPLGAWTVTFVADLLEAAGWKPARNVGDTSVAVGLAGAAAAAATGWNDWQHTSGRSRRIGLVHAALNGAVVLTYAASMAARKSSNRGRGIVLSMSGFAISGLSAYLGGVLVYSEGIGVDHARGVTAPPDFKRVMLLTDLPNGQPRRVEIDGARILLMRRGDRVSAIAESCAHLGGPLSEGELDGDVITCPWHGSRFDVQTGELIDGPSVYPQPRFNTRVRDGWIEVKQ
jgi:nitrite reductase/ring-hydroxylating ferredoxin subunit